MPQHLESFPLRPGPLKAGVGVINGWAVTSYFGGRIDPLTGRAGTHGGMDLAFSGCSGQPMLAVVDGWLSQGWDSSGGGNWSGITAADGSYYGFGHAQAFEPTGGRQRGIRAGEVIGYVGTTGGSTGPHLHFAYRPAGSRFYADPYDLLVAAAAGNTPPAPEVPEPVPPTPEATVPNHLTPARRLSDGSVYIIDGTQARWLIGNTDAALLYPPDDPAIGHPHELNRNDSIDFLRTYEGSGNIPAGSADAFARNNPA